MTNAEILARAIEKAIKNGWNTPVTITAHRIEFIIFDHSFAKCFWGSCDCSWCKEGKNKEHVEYWQWQLQKMVLEEDPISYLAKFLD